MIRINLLGREAEEQSKGLRSLTLPEIGASTQQLGIAAMFIVVLVGIGAIWWAQSNRLGALRVELATVQAERARLREIADEVDTLREHTDLLRQKLKVIVDLKANQSGPVMLLDQVSRLLTDGLWLTQLQFDQGDVTIQGQALSEVSVADYVHNLEGSEYFTDVFLRTLGDSGDALSFQITLHFDPIPGQEVLPRTVPQEAS